MDNFRFSSLEYKRPDLDAYRAKLKDWKAAIEHAESYEALRTLLLEMDRENCELSTQYSIANIRHTLNTRDEFYETEVAYLAVSYTHLQRVLQPPRDGDRAAQVDVVLRKFLRRQRRGGIDGGARLRDDHIGRAVLLPQQLADHGLRLARGRAVAEGDVRDLIPVSYTHLDVYKRQGVWTAAGHPPGGTRLLTCRAANGTPMR